MSASVWFEQVDTGLIQEIRNTVKRYYMGELTELNEKAVIIRKPEEDFKFEVFPCVSIYNLSYAHSKERYSAKLPVKIGLTEEEGKKRLEMEESAIPFDLSYQIDFWAKFQDDMNVMIQTWLTHHFRQFNLKVTDSGGNERTCNCLTKGSVVKSDLLQGGERLFHSVVKLQIWVEINEELRYTTPVVIDRNIVAGHSKEVLD